jgi:hypothetical protein
MSCATSAHRNYYDMDLTLYRTAGEPSTSVSVGVSGCLY